MCLKIDVYSVCHWIIYMDGWQTFPWWKSIHSLLTWQEHNTLQHTSYTTLQVSQRTAMIITFYWILFMFNSFFIELLFQRTLLCQGEGACNPRISEAKLDRCNKTRQVHCDEETINIRLVLVSMAYDSVCGPFHSMFFILSIFNLWLQSIGSGFIFHV